MATPFTRASATGSPRYGLPVYSVSQHSYQGDTATCYNQLLVILSHGHMPIRTVVLFPIGTVLVPVFHFRRDPLINMAPHEKIETNQDRDDDECLFHCRRG